MMQGIEIKLVETKDDLKTFIEFVPELYKDDPNYIQPLTMERMDALDWTKNPYFDHAEVAFWIAYKDGVPVGRISAQNCELYAKQINPDIGQFGLFECINDKRISHVLFQTAADWLRDREKIGMEGPYNLSINQECGLLVDGFDTPPVVMMGHALSYYKDLFELEGFQKTKDMYAYTIDMRPPPPERVKKLTDFARRNKNYHIRKIDKSRMDEELDTIFDIFNDAWSDNWGFIPFTEDEAKAVAKELKPVIFKDQALILEYKGEPTAFLVMIPDVYHYIRDFKGKLFPFNWAKLIWRLFIRPVNHWRVPLMGVRKEFRNTRTGSMMPILLNEQCRDNTPMKMRKQCEMSWILEDNTNMNEMLKSWGGHVYKTYRMMKITF